MSDVTYAAKVAGVSPTTVRRWLSEMTLDGQRNERGVWFLSDRDIQAIRLMAAVRKHRQSARRRELLR